MNVPVSIYKLHISEDTTEYTFNIQQTLQPSLVKE